MCTPTGLPVAFALTNPKLDERDIALDIFEHDPRLLAGRHGQTIVGDKGYASNEFESRLAGHGVELLRPANARRGGRQLKPIRQIIESVFDTLKGQLSLEDHYAHSAQGVLVRVLQQLLALTAAIWRNEHSGAPVRRSLIAYDH